MRKDEFQAFCELMERAADVTVMPNGKNLERVTVALFEGLAAYPLAVVAEAVAAHCRSGRFFPMLSDIVTRIEGKVEDRAAAAWALVLKAVARHGHWDSVRFPVPAIHYAIGQMGGWRHLCCTLTADNIPFRARDFSGHFAVGERVASWEEAAGPGPERVRVPAYLPGEHELNNRARGYDLRRVWDAGTGQLVPDGELPALRGAAAPVRPLVQLMARSMDVREAAGRA